jgi:hypothetical protein
MTTINRGTTEFRSLLDKIPEIEKRYGATYIGDFCIKGPAGGWTNSPVMVFYQPETKSPDHSNYFGMFVSTGGAVMICDASSTVGIPIQGVESGGEIVYSRYRHDYRQTSDGMVAIDGGRDYTKVIGQGKQVTLVIEDGELRVVADPDSLYLQHTLTLDS